MCELAFVNDLFKKIFCKKNVLLLQGPVGPFFLHLTNYLKKEGKQVAKVNFNGGDLFFYPLNATLFRNTLSVWSVKLKKIIAEKGIEQIVLFGEHRPIHCVARQVAKELDIEIVVFEEGYLRPDYITLEKNGVNGLSAVPRERGFYDALPPVKKMPARVILGNTFYYAALWAFIYYVVSALLFPIFRKYQHHRPMNFVEAFCWLRSITRRYLYQIKEKNIYKLLTGALHKKYYLAPLQVYNDAQIIQYSNFSSVCHFIKRVMQSFAKNAPADTYLVFKHHPLDRAYRDYTKLIAMLCRKFNIEGRVYYIHDQHLPSLLTAALGVIVINSTVGLSALFHKTPTKVMGKAVYDIDGLTYQKSLGSFFNECQHYKVDNVLYQKFILYLVENTQLNGNFYKSVEVGIAKTKLKTATIPTTVPERGFSDRDVAA